MGLFFILSLRILGSAIYCFTMNNKLGGKNQIMPHYTNNLKSTERSFMEKIYVDFPLPPMGLDGASFLVTSCYAHGTDK